MCAKKPRQNPIGSERRIAYESHPSGGGKIGAIDPIGRSMAMTGCGQNR